MTAHVYGGVVLAIAIGVAGCADERGAVLQVMNRARTAVLAGDGQTACRLLTAHGRRRVLGFQVDFAPTGTRVPTTRRGVPQTCAQILHAEAGLDRSWIRDLRGARLGGVAIDGDAARVRLLVDGPDVQFALRRTAQGWRIDDSDAVPSGY
jgi:hypothetical protein